jgi:hypothetical protein
MKEIILFNNKAGTAKLYSWFYFWENISKGEVIMSYYNDPCSQKKHLIRIILVAQIGLHIKTALNSEN